MTKSELLLHVRSSKGHTQCHVAKLVGTSGKSISLWERDESEPRKKFWARLAHYCNISEDAWALLGAPLSPRASNETNSDSGEESMAGADGITKITVPVCGTMHSGQMKFTPKSAVTDWKSGTSADLNSFVMMVDGSSLSPAYLDRDQIFFDTCNITIQEAGASTFLLNADDFETLNGRLCLLQDGKWCVARILRMTHATKDEYHIKCGLPNSDTVQDRKGGFSVIGIATKCVRDIHPIRT